MKLKKSDSIKLGRAVSRFNKIISKVQGKTSYIPQTKSYKDLKENILTRKEFNKVLRELKSANIENMLNLKQLGDIIVTEYEYNNIKRNQRNAIASLKYQIKKSQENLFQTNRRTGYFKDVEKGLNITLNSIKNIENKKGENLLNAIKRIDYNSNSKNYRSAINFKNFYETYVMPELEGYDGFEKLREKLDKFKSPKSYYEYIKSSPMLIDLVGWYEKGGSNTFVDVKASLAGYGMEQQDAFNYAIESELGL